MSTLENIIITADGAVEATTPEVPVKFRWVRSGDQWAEEVSQSGSTLRRVRSKEADFIEGQENARQAKKYLNDFRPIPQTAFGGLNVALGNTAFEVSDRDSTLLNGREVDVISIANHKSTLGTTTGRQTWYIAKDTSLPLRMIFRNPSPISPYLYALTEWTFSDYRPCGSAMIPFRIDARLPVGPSRRMFIRTCEAQSVNYSFTPNHAIQRGMSR